MPKRHKPKTTSPGKKSSLLVPVLIKFHSMTLAKARARMEKEQDVLYPIHANTFTGLVNELVRRYGNGEVNV